MDMVHTQDLGVFILVYDTSIGDTFNYLKKRCSVYQDLVINIITSNGEILSYLIIFLLSVTTFSEIIQK